MLEPKLRTVNKAIPPFLLNSFPKHFINVFAKNIVYLLATKKCMSLEGNEWEQIFAEAVGAEWKPSNVGLDDIILNNCCWGAKTVFSQSNICSQEKVRLISGRNSPTFSFGQDKITSSEPNEIGKMVLSIWNERVSAVRQVFKFVRTVVLVKSKDYRDFLIFEFDTVRYDPELYYFNWNSRGNLEGYEKKSNIHKFTWQPSGSQFTIIEDIPCNRLHIQIKHPNVLDREAVLNALHFDDDWYEVLD
ncbi:MAG: hypothetical protein IJ660_01940 [Alphaproteobacteria bacterium]|nr:hypothetical protein [Alphaproteobacteria bacterium]